jgi:hypothetical protein
MYSEPSVGLILPFKDKTVTAQSASPKSSYRESITNDVRRRALERLYERREIVSELISVLEKYQDQRRGRLAPCIDISVARKCLSGSAR